MVTLPGGRFWSFCCCAAVLGVITLKPEATSMLSLFCVLVCVPAQLSNNAAHPAVIVVRTIYFIGLIGRNGLLIRFQTIASESDSGGDLRAVHDSVETEAIVLKVSAECPITNLGKNRAGKVDPDYALDLPHQVGPAVETSAFTADRQ